jgi:hypothetical protein
VESRPGQGSRFTLELPSNLPPAKSQAAANLNATLSDSSVGSRSGAPDPSDGPISDSSVR